MRRAGAGHPPRMRVVVEEVRALWFADGTPVTAASGIAPLGDGWLVVQDDATIAAWHRPGAVTPVRLFPPVDGHDTFSEARGTKLLKPDLEVACPAEADGGPAALLMGSGSAERRMRGAVVQLRNGHPVVRTMELGPLYARAADRLGVPPEQLNLEGASRHGDVLRWYQRGNLAAGVPSASVDVPLGDLVAVVLGRRPADSVALGDVHAYDLGQVEGVGLAVTDAVALPDGRELLSAAAEDSPNAVDDGPVVATAVVLVHGGEVLDLAPIPEVDGPVHKVEGLALRGVDGDRVRLLAVVDDDDPATPSAELDLRVELGDR